MHWAPEDGAGFTEPGVKPWLPFGDFAARNVAYQQGDSGSTLAFVRDLIALRRESEDLRGGAYATLVATESSWAWQRGRGTIVALNLSDSAETVEGVQGAISIATSRERDGERVGGRLRLEPWSGAVVS
jgi:alpha-glucosidase